MKPPQTQVKSKLIPLDKIVEIHTVLENGKSLTFGVLWDGQTSVCQKCGGTIAWGLTAKRKWVPFDPDTGDAHWTTCQQQDEELI